MEQVRKKEPTLNEPMNKKAPTPNEPLNKKEPTLNFQKTIEILKKNDIIAT